MVLARCNLVIQDEDGNIVDGATVTVQRESDLVLVNLYSDRAGASSLGNPFIASDGAAAGFHAAGGAYKITAALGGFSRIWRYVAVGTAAETDVETFDTVTVAEAAQIQADSIVVLGYSAAFDSPAARWNRVASGPSHFGKFQSDDGGWFEIDRNQWIEPEMLGVAASGNVTTFFTNFFAMLVVWGNGWRVRLKHGRTYEIYSGISAYTNLFTFDGMDDWVFDGTGAKFKTMYTNGAFVVDIGIVLTCKRWKVLNFNVEMNTIAAHASQGNNGLTIKEGCEDFDILNYRQTGGSRGVAILRDPGDITSGRCRRYNITGYCDRVFYGTTIQGDGDFGYVHLEGAGCGRTFSFAGIRGLRFDILSTLDTTALVYGDFVIGTLGNYTNSGQLGYTEDFRGTYTAIHPSGTSNAGVVLQHTSQTTANAPAIIRNFHIDMHLVSTGGTWLKAIDTSTFKRDGSNNVVVGDAAGYDLSNGVITCSLHGNCSVALATLGLSSAGYTSNTTFHMQIRDLHAPSCTADMVIGALAHVKVSDAEAPACDVDFTTDSAAFFYATNVRFGNLEGSYGSNQGPFLLPATYLAAGDGIANDDTPWRAIIDSVIAGSGGHIFAKPGKTYRLDLTGYAAGFSWKQVDNKYGVIYSGNGSKLLVEESLGLNSAFFLLFRPSHYITFENARFEAPSGIDSPPRGITWFYVEACTHTTFRNLNIIGGFSGLAVVGTQLANSKRTRIENCYFEDDFYPVQLQGVEGAYVDIVTKHAGRSLFITSSKHIYARVNSTDSLINDVIVQALSDTGRLDFNVESLELYYRGRTLAVAGTTDAISVQWNRGATSNAAALSGLDFTIDIEASAGFATSGAVQLLRNNNAGADSSGSVVHTLDGLRIRGRSVGNASAAGISIPYSGHTIPETDRISNVHIGPWFGRGHYYVGGSGGTSVIVIDGLAFDNPLILEDIDIDGVLTLTNFAADMVDFRGFGKSSNINWSPMVPATVGFFDDFEGDVIDDAWGVNKGSDGAAVDFATVVAADTSGKLQGTTGADAGATMALNGIQLHRQLNWKASQKGLVCEFKVKMSAITSVAVFVGFTDQIASLEMPFTLGASDALTSNASDAVGVLFDTAADADNWWLVGVKADADATKQNAAVAPVANTYEVWRIWITDAGVARFYRNGVKIGTAMADAVTAATALTPVVVAFSRTNSARTVALDYASVRAMRA